MTLRQLFCRHRHDRRERDTQGRVVLVCDSCGRSVLALERTPQERKQMGRKYPLPKPMEAQGSSPKVTPMRRRSR